MRLSSRITALLRHAKIEVRHHPLIKFLLVFLLLIVYLLFTSHKFGAREGFLISTLTWSFFVLCTPIADAGFLLDFPIRLITGIRMIFSEIMVWILAIAINIFALFFAPHAYEDTILLSLFSHILSQPFPYFAIILLSGVGTFLSIVFGDELMDVAFKKKDSRAHHAHHRHKHHFIVIIFLIILVLILYDFLLNSMGFNIPLL